MTLNTWTEQFVDVYKKLFLNLHSTKAFMKLFSTSEYIKKEEKYKN